MYTFASLFTGMGGADLGAIAAGFTPIWGIELENSIASVARLNLGSHIITASVADINPADLPAPDCLHISPPCQHDSQARKNSKFERTDSDIGLAAIKYIEVLRPKIVTLENVALYQHNPAFSAILAALYRLGYWVDVKVIDCSDYGLPQSRVRLLVRAALGSLLPELPAPSGHAGWLAAVKDLIPEFEGTEFAEYTAPFLPPAEADNFVVNGTLNNRGTGLTVRYAHDPIFTIPASAFNKVYRAKIGGRVVKLNTRALARLQGIPDSYQLPPVKHLAQKIVGNAVPPMLERLALEGLKPLIKEIAAA